MGLEDLRRNLTKKKVDGFRQQVETMRRNMDPSELEHIDLVVDRQIASERLIETNGVQSRWADLFGSNTACKGPFVPDVLRYVNAVRFFTAEDLRCKFSLSAIDEAFWIRWLLRYKFVVEHRDGYVNSIDSVMPFYRLMDVLTFVCKYKFQSEYDSLFYPLDRYELTEILEFPFWHVDKSVLSADWFTMHYKVGNNRANLLVHELLECNVIRPSGRNYVLTLDSDTYDDKVSTFENVFGLLFEPKTQLPLFGYNFPSSEFTPWGFLIKYFVNDGMSVGVAVNLVMAIRAVLAEDAQYFSVVQTTASVDLLPILIKYGLATSFSTPYNVHSVMSYDDAYQWLNDVMHKIDAIDTVHVFND